MTELKTLKDLNLGYEGYAPEDERIREGLRSEAVKWIKEDKKWYLNQMAKILRGEKINSTTSDLMKRWMKRLDISKEDLE